MFLFVVRYFCLKLFKAERVWVGFLMAENYRFFGVERYFSILIVFLLRFICFGAEVAFYKCIFSLNWWGLVRANNFL